MKEDSQINITTDQSGITLETCHLQAVFLFSASTRLVYSVKSEDAEQKEKGQNTALPLNKCIILKMTGKGKLYL